MWKLRLENLGSKKAGIGLVDVPLEGLNGLIASFPEGAGRHITVPIVVIYNIRQLAEEIAKCLKDSKEG